MNHDPPLRAYKCQTPVTILTYLSPLFICKWVKNSATPNKYHLFISLTKQITCTVHTHTRAHTHSTPAPHCVQTRMNQLLSVYTLERDSRNTQRQSAFSLLSTYPQTVTFPGPFALLRLPASPSVCLVSLGRARAPNRKLASGPSHTGKPLPDPTQADT